MADKSASLILEALGRAIAEPMGVPLFTSKSVPGLFATSAPAKKAAQECKDQNLVRVLRTETRGKSTLEICAITEKGLARLLAEVSPKQVLENFVHALESRKIQVGELVAAARNWEAGLDALRATAEKILHQLHQSAQQPPPASAPLMSPGRNGADAWIADLVGHLTQWRASGNTQDCPLPDLYRRAATLVPHLTIGQFHDGLRTLHERGQLYLHPWTGPLYDLPEPPFALLVGHEIAYYASPRP